MEETGMELIEGKLDGGEENVRVSNETTTENLKNKTNGEKRNELKGRIIGGVDESIPLESKNLNSGTSGDKRMIENSIDEDNEKILNTEVKRMESVEKKGDKRKNLDEESKEMVSVSTDEKSKVQNETNGSKQNESGEIIEEEEEEIVLKKNKKPSMQFSHEA
uniref:Uncharacterized protein n=1 Tax=Caenorhabditis tropicalis TaxID=1561998 RepID=A0A1I7ULC4_9PELO